MLNYYSIRKCVLLYMWTVAASATLALAGSTDEVSLPNLNHYLVGQTDLEGEVDEKEKFLPDYDWFQRIVEKKGYNFEIHEVST